ncbi:NUDIX hydrolase [Actinokineospora bangkokensis]|uniref:NUDIX hydrolase n=1 Tax=Actinokineospora bangkokensis TaxID=1193682 RepID=A0A1Q9LSU8_9PSEU|nr:NUDIX domain-containing protein [Actinokineospora bangkokensis]OLR95080.1 NUDIX hydrolase [Actinokineospora bangkokensis]
MGRIHEAVRLTADLIILTIRDGALNVLLVERENEPHRGRLALPGGFLRGDEPLERTAERELAEETGLDASAFRLRQVRVYSEPDRDPRRPRVITCGFLAIAPNLPSPVAGSDARSARWVPVVEAAGAALAFDHGRILADAVDLARDLLQFSTVATAFCGPEFTIGDLREVYETVWGVALDRPNFHRKVTDALGFVEPTGGKRPSPGGRPAALYRAGGATELSPPMMRPRVDA